jgi:hypothetical protein
MFLKRINLLLISSSFNHKKMILPTKQQKSLIMLPRMETMATSKVLILLETLVLTR